MVFAYRSAREEVIALLEASDALNRNIYRSTTLARAFSVLDGWQAHSLTLLAEQDFSALEKLSESELHRSCKQGKSAPAHPFSLDRAFFEAYRALLSDLDAYYVSFVHRLRDHLQRAEDSRVEAMSLSFDDLLSVVDNAVARYPALCEAVRGQYRAALIDEFQDTDPRQFRDLHHSVWQRFSTHFGGRSEASDLYRFAAPISRHTCAPPISLSIAPTGLRPIIGPISPLSTPSMRCFRFAPIRSCIRKSRSPRCAQSTEIACNRVGATSPGCVWIFCSNGRRSQRSRVGKCTHCARRRRRHFGVAAKVLTIDNRPVEPRDFAILVRTNDDAAIMERALRQAGIPSVIHSQLSVFATPEARELELISATVAAPYRPRRVLFWRRARACSGLTAHDLAEESPLFAMRREWAHDSSRWFSRRIFQAFSSKMLAGLDATARLLSEDRGERALTNWLHLGELLHQAERAQNQTPLSLMRLFSKWISRFNGARCAWQRCRPVAARNRCSRRHDHHDP